MKNGEIEVREYVKTLKSHYLDDYIVQGGSAVKFVATDDGLATRAFSAALSSAALDLGFLHVAINSGVAPVQFVENIFFAVSRQIDWFGLATMYVRRCYAELGMSLGGLRSPDATSVAAVARANGMHEGELYRSMRRLTENKVLTDGALSPEFRIAVLRACQNVLAWTDVTEVEKQMLLQWLHGSTVPLEKLRAIGLQRRIQRNNARQVLTSLCHWLRLCGLPGLVIQVDLSRFAVVRRPPLAARRGFYYSRANVLDTYEVLRQFVDSADEMEGVLMVIVAPTGLLGNKNRGLRSYQALQQRVFDEVYDELRANPMATLVRVTASEGERA